MAVTMTQKKDMIQKRMNFGIVFDDKNKNVYVFGGYGDDFLDKNEKYSVEKNEWTELTPMN